MSSSDVCAVWPGEKSEKLITLRNSWGTAPYIWDEMAIKYLDVPPHCYFSRTNDLWPLYRREDISIQHRAVLAMTYDNALIHREDFARAAKDIRQFMVDFPVNPEHVNHWGHIAALFEASPDCPAIGFWMTSVSESPFQGSWNEELEEYDQPDWSKFWNVYSSLA